MKNIDQLIPDIQTDADKIAKAFNSTVAKEFYNVLEEESKDWYYQNKSKGIYKRTKQLRDKAILKEKENDYEYKISFSAKNIQRLSGSYNTESKKSNLSSYESMSGEDVASKVLQQEEEGSYPFNTYKYQKGEGIWGSALKYFMNKINSLKIETSKLNLPDNIKNDLIELMKKNLKEQLEKEYQEDFG